MNANSLPRRSLLLLASSGALALAGCKTVGPDFARPAAPGAGAYLGAGEPSPRLQAVQLGEAVADRWWSYFASPELDQVMRLAVANNPSLQAAEASLAAAQAQIRAASAAGGLQVSGSSGISRQRMNLQSFGFDTSRIAGFDNNPSFSLYSVGASASYALDPFGLNRREVEAATARAEVEARRADAAYLSLTGNVALQAAKIAAVRAEIAAVEAVLAEDDRILDIAAKAAAGGATGDAPKVNAEAQRTADAARLPPLRQELAEARHALALLVGKAPADWSAPDFSLAALKLPTAVPVSLPSELVRRRPDILAAEAQLHAATAEVGVATAELYPTLNLTAALTQSALSIPDLFKTTATSGNIGAALAGPLYDGGRRRARKAAAEAQARAALASYQGVVVQAFVQVADLMHALAEDEAALAAQQAALATAERSLRLADAGWRGGATGIAPVIDAQRQLSIARLSLVRVEAQRYAHTVQLFAATGSGLRDVGA